MVLNPFTALAVCHLPLPDSLVAYTEEYQHAFIVKAYDDDSSA